MEEKVNKREKGEIVSDLRPAESWKNPLPVDKRLADGKKVSE